jgi:FkbM family methyltransferase
MGFARTALELVLDRRELCIRRKDDPPRGFAGFLRVYRKHAPPPQTVFDIGVGNGTPWLYEAFPDATFVLVEPLRDFAPNIDAILQKYKGECHYCALAEREGELVLHVPVGNPTGASLLSRHPDWAAYKATRGDSGIVERRVPVTTLDSLAADASGPHVVKIDVEGAEIMVMRGGKNCIGSADLLIVEASITPRHANENDFVDIACYLKTQGFILLEIAEMATIAPYNMLAYLDAVFVRLDAPFLRSIRGSILPDTLPGTVVARRRNLQ